MIGSVRFVLCLALASAGGCSSFESPPTPAEIAAKPLPQGCEAIEDEFDYCDVGCRPNSPWLICQIYGQEMKGFERRRDCMRAVVERLRVQRDNFATCVAEAETQKSTLDREVAQLSTQVKRLNGETQTARRNAERVLADSSKTEQQILDTNKKYKDLASELDRAEDSLRERATKLDALRRLERKVCAQDEKCDFQKLEKSTEPKAKEPKSKKEPAGVRGEKK